MKDILITCLIVFFVRILDVLMGTMTTMFVAKANTKMAVIFGFIQTIVWITALKLVMDKLTNPIYLVVYAIAYSVGVAIAIILERKMAIGDITLQAVINENQKDVIKVLREEYKLIVTCLEAQGVHNEKRIVLLISVKRKKSSEIIKYLRSRNIFITINFSTNYLNMK